MLLSSTPPVEARASYAASQPERQYFFVTGLSEPDLLARVLAPFVKIGLTPYRLHATNEHGSGAETAIDLRFSGLDRDLTECLAAKCRAIVGVQTVLTASD